MAPHETYLVVVDDPKGIPFMDLAKALAAIRKTAIQDQVHAAKRSWGLVAENLTAPEAEALSHSLRQMGIPTRVLPAASGVTLPSLKPLSQWEDGLVNGLVLIAAAAVTVHSTKTKLVREGPTAGQQIMSTAILLGTGLPIKIGGKARTVEKTEHQSEQVFYLDLIFQNPAGRRRVEAQSFNYSFLKERKQYNVLGNFKLLLGELAGQAKEAWRNLGTRILLENKPIQTMGYESLADLERECRWLLTLKANQT